MFHLIKKDLLLVRVKLIFIAVINFVIPVFMSSQGLQGISLYALISQVFFSMFIIFQSISVEEEKCPKALAILCATTYSRKDIVLAKYVLFLMVCAVSILQYFMISIVVKFVATPTVLDVLYAILVTSVLFGIYTPLQIKLGYTTSRLIMLVGMFLVFYLYPLLSQFGIKVDLSIIIQQELIVYVCLLFASALWLLISMHSATMILNKKEL